MSEDARVTRDFLGEDFIGVQRVLVPGGTSVLDDLRALQILHYRVGTQTASQTQSASLPCPATMDFGGVSGFLIP